MGIRTCLSKGASTLRSSHMPSVCSTRGQLGLANQRRLTSTMASLSYPRLAAPSSLAAESFLNGESSPYTEQMYEAWLNDRKSVHASWDAYFTNLKNGVALGKAFSLAPPPSAASQILPGEQFASAGLGSPEAIGNLPAGASYFTIDALPTGLTQSVHDTSRIIQMIRGYQIRGHEMAKIEPLGLPVGPPFTSVARLGPPTNIDYKYYGFTESDLDRVYDCRVPGLSGFLSPDREPRPLRQIIERLLECYCGSIGVEYMHIGDQNICNFLRQKIETAQKYSFSPEMRRKILVRTARSHLFETFCANKFSTAKRFGLEGCDTLIVGLKGIYKKAAREGVNSILFGMPHRGRLNVLFNVLHKPMQQMMSEFQGVTGFGGTEWGNTGDVKYHLGVEFDHWDSESQRHIHMGVLANPSHLEAVDPLLLGQARAQQYYSGDSDKSKVLPIVIHGDASFAGQGVVYETLQMSKLPSYDVGGTIHIVVNNQVGFTTCSVDGGSGKYCTDLAKAIDAPVFHVNADDPEAVTFVSELALEYRQRFKSDVFIDLVGYRRFGHNELDMPKFTQPLMYTLIARHPSVLDIYEEKLVSEGIVTKEETEEIKKNIFEFYSHEYEKSKTFEPTAKFYEYLPQWQHMVQPNMPVSPRVTGVKLDHLKELSTSIFTLPSSLNPHPSIAKIFKARLDSVDKGENIDFGTAELLAYASLLSDGFHVRLSGQDTQRGTFSHRHAVLHDQTLFNKYNIFEPLKAPQKIEVNNSPLSEFAALGFEVGYATEHPDTLCIWEAQFGDFANGCQVTIDQFIVSGESKWNRQCGVVLMLPHGFDGSGPEHSSARIERFLQLCDDREDVIHPENWELTQSSVIQQHNIQVVNCTLPSNTFHALRRQMHRGFRKPLIMFTPKAMLKLRAAFCSLDLMKEDTRFLRYIPDIPLEGSDPLNVKRMILCSGQVYYVLKAHRDKLGAKDVAIARVEQLSPFPFDKMIEDLKHYPNLQDVVWAQEEPMNNGPWFYTSKRIESLLRHMGEPNGIRTPLYVGRDVHPSVAVGDSSVHKEQLNQLLADAFDLTRKKHSYVEVYESKYKHS